MDYKKIMLKIYLSGTGCFKKFKNQVFILSLLLHCTLASAQESLPKGANLKVRSEKGSSIGDKAQKGSNALLVQKVSNYMQAQKEINDFSGTVFISRNDSILFQQAYGLADRELSVPNIMDTKFGLASITKQFTAVAILQLEAQGKLKLDDKLDKYFPGFPKGQEVSIHQLLTHTAGLALDFEELYLEHTTTDLDSAIQYIKTLPYQSEPGAQVKYSNVGYFLLSQIIAKSSGLSYGDYLKQHIFDPIGMENTGLYSNELIIKKLAKSYYREGQAYFKNPFINWTINIGLDGMYSTAADLYKFDRALYGNVLLSNASKIKMTTKHNKAFPDKGFFDSYGYGVFINPYFNHGHEMLTHSGGYFGVMTTMDRYPKDNVFVTVLSNNQSESHMIGYGLGGIMFGKTVENPYQHKQVQINPEILLNYTGQYGDFKILEKAGKLYLNNPETELLPESTTKFFRADNPDRTFEFVRIKNKKVMILTKGGVKESIAFTPAK